MNLDELKGKATQLMGQAEEFINKPENQEKIHNAKEKGEELMNKGKEFLQSEKVQELKGKAEDFVADKTDGKGIFGFGKK